MWRTPFSVTVNLYQLGISVFETESLITVFASTESAVSILLLSAEAVSISCGNTFAVQASISDAVRAANECFNIFLLDMAYNSFQFKNTPIF